MPALSGCTVMVLSGHYRVLQEGRKSCLPNLGVVAPYFLGETRKRVQGADSMCPCCGKVEEDFEYVLRACPKLDRRRNFVQIPPPLSAISTVQVEVARFFREVFDWDHP
jgi:hypothetical protein